MQLKLKKKLKELVILNIKKPCKINEKNVFIKEVNIFDTFYIFNFLYKSYFHFEKKYGLDDVSQYILYRYHKIFIEFIFKNLKRQFKLLKLAIKDQEFMFKNKKLNANETFLSNDNLNFFFKKKYANLMYSKDLNFKLKFFYCADSFLFFDIQEVIINLFLKNSTNALKTYFLNLSSENENLNLKFIEEFQKINMQANFKSKDLN